MDIKGAIRKGLGGKLQERSQLCEVFTDDGRIRDTEFEAPTACIVNKDTMDAFLLEPSSQLTNRDNGKSYQIIGEESTLPLTILPRDPSDIVELRKKINDVYHESQAICKVMLHKRVADEKFKTWIVGLVTIPIIMFCLAAAYGLWSNRNA